MDELPWVDTERRGQVKLSHHYTYTKYPKSQLSQIVNKIVISRISLNSKQSICANSQCIILAKQQN